MNKPTCFCSGKEVNLAACEGQFVTFPWTLHNDNFDSLGILFYRISSLSVTDIVTKAPGKAMLFLTDNIELNQDQHFILLNATLSDSVLYRLNLEPSNQDLADVRLTVYKLTGMCRLSGYHNNGQI